MRSFFSKLITLDFFYKFILLIVASFFAFYGLGSQSLANWDEGIYINVVREMGAAPRFLPTVGQQVWLEKPPFGFWLHWLGAHFFGLNNFGLRVVPALFFVGGVLFFYLLAKKFYSPILAFFLSLAFAVSPLLYVSHMIRTGDLDSYFLFIVIFTFWLYSVSWKKSQLFWLLGLVLGTGFLIRGYIVLVLFFILLGHLLLTKKYKVIGWRQIKLASLAFLLVVVPWHLYALIKYPKEFIASYLQYHLLGRITRPLEGHVGSMWFYPNFFISQLRAVFLFLVGSVVFLLHRLLKYPKDENILWLLWFFIFFFCLQMMGTKIIWYSIGLIPVFYLMCAPLVSFIFDREAGSLLGTVVKIVFIFGVAFYFFFFTTRALLAILYPVAWPIDTVDKYVSISGRSGVSIVVYDNKNQDVFSGPAVDFQWKKTKGYYVIIANDENIYSYINSNEKLLFLTDVAGYKKIRSVNLQDKWSAKVLEYFYTQWGNWGVPVIVERK